MTDMNRALCETLNQGATKATVISTSDIVLSEKFYDICASNSCGKFGHGWVCPPDSGDIFTLMDKVRSYSNGILYQTIVDIEDSFDIEGMSEGAKLHAQLSQKIRKNVEPLLGDDTMHLSCGGCNLCTKCSKIDNEPCRHPDMALLSMECCGIDVYNTTKPTDLKYINGQNTVTFFGLVLFNE